jgi:sulfate permease, SulP family
VLSLAVIFGLRQFAPVVPGSLVAVLLGIAAVTVFGLQHHGVEIVGPIKSGLPWFGIPDLHASDVGALAAGEVGVMLVGFAEGLGAAKTYAAREHQIDANRELLASEARTSPPRSRAGWSSTAACQRPLSTPPPAPAASSQA